MGSDINLRGRKDSSKCSLVWWSRPLCGCGRVEGHAFACCRMPELEMSAVESQTRGSHRTCSVELIPDHGMTALCQMDSNLVFPSRLKTNLDETCFRFAFQNTNVSDGELAGTAFGCGIDTISSVFVQEGPNRKFIGRHASFHDGSVNATCCVIFELTLKVCLLYTS